MVKMMRLRAKSTSKAINFSWLKQKLPAFSYIFLIDKVEICIYKIEKLPSISYIADKLMIYETTICSNIYDIIFSSLQR